MSESQKHSAIIAYSTAIGTVAIIIYAALTYCLLRTANKQRKEAANQTRLWTDQLKQEKTFFDLLNSPLIELSVVRADSNWQGRILAIQITNNGNTAARIEDVKIYATSDRSGLHRITTATEIPNGVHDLPAHGSVVVVSSPVWTKKLKAPELEDRIFIGAELKYKDMQDSEYVYHYLGHYEAHYDSFFIDISGTEKYRGPANKLN